MLRPMPIIDVFEIAHWLGSTGKLSASQAEVERYWAHLKNTGQSWAIRHEASQHPFMLYGDEVVFTQSGEKLLVYSIAPVLQESRTSWTSHYPVFVIRSARSLGYRTLQPYFRRISWGFNVLFTGYFPYADSEGNAYSPASLEGQRAGSKISIKGALTEILGDWKSHVDTFSLLPTYSSNNICFKCKASKNGRYIYTDFSDTPDWHTSRRDTAGFVNECLPNFHPSSLLCVYFFDVSWIKFCHLHCGPLGIFLYINGGLLAMLTDRNHFGVLPLDQQLKAAWDKFKAWARAEKVEIPSLFYKSFQHPMRGFSALSQVIWLNAHARCSQPVFRSALLHRATGEFVYYTAKGFNSRCILAWLARESELCLDQHPEDVQLQFAHHLARLGANLVASFLKVGSNSPAAGF